MVPPQPDWGSSTWAPTTTTFIFRWAACAFSARSAISSGNDERARRDLRLNFSMRSSLILLRYLGGLRKHGQAIDIKFLVKIEAKQIRGGFEFHGRIQEVPQTRHALVYRNLRKQSGFHACGYERRDLVPYARAFNLDFL